MNMLSKLSFACVVLCCAMVANGKDQELAPFQGHWEVIELVEDGHVIPHEAIPEWLPSGGQFEIVDNSMLFTSHEDGKKHVRLFEIDATQFPRAVDLITREKKEAVGIYKFDEGKLIACFSDPEDGTRPSEFSAKKGSKRMLMVMKKVPAPAKGEKAAAPARQANASPSAAGKIVTDQELAKMIAGTWRYVDDGGALILTVRGNGSWSTIREVQEMRLFQKVFVRTPVSSGTWTLKNGTLNLLCTASLHPERINHTLPFTVRSISETDFIFVDYLGRVGKAVKMP